MSNRLVPIAIALTVAACTAGGMSGDDRAARVDALLTDYRGNDRPGACVLARSRGAIVYQQCFGLAERETERLNTPETDFRLASLTKQFTATAILSLVQAGKLHTRTTLRQLFPDFPPYGEAVTIHHLLTHTSGLIDYEDLMPEDDTTQIRDAGVLALMMAQDSTYFPPGSAFRYSNSAYALLAMVVERLSEKSFGTYLSETIFEPLGMAGTVAHEEELTEVPNRAYGYSRQDDGSWRRTDQSTTSAVLGDGGIYTSLTDMNRWLTVVEGRDTLVAPGVFAQAFHEATLADGAGAGYGYGWYLDTYRGLNRYRHSGSTVGFRNEVQRFPDEDLTVLFLSNRNEIDESLADAIAEVFLEDRDAP
ncbi:MAG: beta-lactamase family protein [Gemmatimonadales bacterium]|nr:beta-lactamase family protein [Gemmatimonadales bacterium]